MYRIALGYDLHRLIIKENSSIICGGINIPCNYQIEGAHSDGDVIFHALTDALLSLTGTDIGQVFPNDSEENFQRNSLDFITYAFKSMKSIYRIVNIDIVVICDAPKISPHAFSIRENIASILDISINDISIRGKTTEKTKPLSIEAYCNTLFQKII